MEKEDAFLRTTILYCVFFGFNYVILLNELITIIILPMDSKVHSFVIQRVVRIIDSCMFSFDALFESVCDALKTITVVVRTVRFVYRALDEFAF